PASGHLPEALSGLSIAELTALARANQLRRWRAGERVFVEEYLRRFPALAQRPEAVLDLAYAEVLAREEQGEAPKLEEDLARFPGPAAALRRQFELHRALASAALLEDEPSTAQAGNTQGEDALPKPGVGPASPAEGGPVPAATQRVQMGVGGPGDLDAG